MNTLKNTKNWRIPCENLKVNELSSKTEIILDHKGDEMTIILEKTTNKVIYIS